MSDLLAECDWRDGTLFLVLPEDPERIGVRLFPSRYAPSRVYVPEAEIVRTKAENAKLRELVDGLRYCANESHGHGRCSVRFVDGYVTYCPLYDVDSDTARCEALLRELGVEVPS